MNSSETEKRAAKSGIIEISKRGLFTVRENGRTVMCKCGTRLRHEKTEPLCGDIAVFEDNGDGTGFITGLLPRKNSLPRPEIANVDALVLTIAVTHPEPDFFYVDKMTCVGESAGLETVIVVNKTDLAGAKRCIDIYEKCGFRVFGTSADTGEGINELKAYLAGKTVVFAGPSGVGKSSLINRMYEGFHAETGELSSRIQRGKNTTRHTELFRTEDGGYIADTPGFTSIDFDNSGLFDSKLPLYENAGKLAGFFPEFARFTVRCRYNDCTHSGDEGCAVRKAVASGDIPQSRYESYMKLYDIIRSEKA